MNSARAIVNQLKRQNQQKSHGGRHLLLKISRSLSRSGPSLGGDVLPKSARVVICGGGIVGNSVAYHFAQKGWTDVVLLEQNDEIGRGTSAFGSGVLALLKPVEEQQIINKSIAIYKKLQADGHDIRLRECGSLYLAQNRERMVLFRRRVALNKPKGVECKVRSIR
jgi:pyruvate dehydrogenase phosphatase regulatory subunit